MSHYTINTVEGDRAEIVFHGVPYADFDRTGHWSIWAISKMFEASRLIPLYHGFLHFQQVDGAHHGLVVRKQVLSLNPKLHQTISLFSKLRMKFNLDVLSLGRTSVTYVSRFTDGESGEVLAENFVKFVRIDRKTRRATEFPTFFQEKYGFLIGKKTLPFLDNRAIAEDPQNDAYTYDMVASSSDTDRNSHVNQAMYVKYCMDCATEASLNKYYKNFDSDMCMYTTTKWEIDYIGESGARDSLKILTWQSRDDLRHINFSIRLEQKEIFRASTVFELEKQISPAKRNKSHWSIWSISKMFEASRLMALKHRFLGIFSSNSKDGATLVVVKQLLRLNPRLHQISYFTPLCMKFVLEIGEVGSSSFIYVIRMADDKTGEILGENLLKYVRIGRESRRAELLPIWFREKYSTKANENIPSTFKRSAPPEMPSNVFRFKLQPLASDMDSNGHVNQSVYLKYCTDAAYVAVRAGYLKHFHDDICRYPSTSWEVSYLGESFAGDTLEVSLWQNATEHNVIFFLIERENKKIFYSISTFVIEGKRKSEYVQSKV